jgi:hypothetical protein
LGERIIDDVRAVLGAEPGDLRALRAVLMVGYATTGRTNDAIALRHATRCRTIRRPGDATMR